MNQIHEHSNAIYEHLVDKEYDEVASEVSMLSEVLRTLSDSINNGRAEEVQGMWRGETPDRVSLCRNKERQALSQKKMSQVL